RYLSGGAFRGDVRGSSDQRRWIARGGACRTRLAADCDPANNGLPPAPPAAPPTSQRIPASYLLLEGLALLVTVGYPAGVPVLQRALTAFRSDVLSLDESMRWLWPACIAAANLWDDGSWHVLAAQYLETVRQAGALSELPLALNSHV